MRGHVTSQPGNPGLTAVLRATDEATVHAYADKVRRTRGLPDEVLHHLLDDMAVTTDKLRVLSCVTLRKYGAPCEHGPSCPNRVAVA